MLIAKHKIVVLTCEPKYENGKFYIVEYLSDGLLPYQKHANVWIEDTKKRQFIGTIRHITKNSLHILSEKYPIT